MTMINRTVLEIDLLSHWISTNVVAANRTHARGRQDLAQRTERFPLSREAT
jgi:hypothetical protein